MSKFKRDDTDQPVLSNHHCHAYGCPMPGSRADTIKPTAETAWYCRFHFGIVDPAQRDAITTRIKAYRRELVPLRGKRGIRYESPVSDDRRMDIDNIVRGLSSMPTPEPEPEPEPEATI